MNSSESEESSLSDRSDYTGDSSVSDSIDAQPKNRLLLVQPLLDGMAAVLVAIGCGFDGDIRTAHCFDVPVTGYSDVVTVGMVVSSPLVGRYNVRAYSDSVSYYEHEWRSHSDYNEFLQQITALVKWNENEMFDKAISILEAYRLHRPSSFKEELLYSHHLITPSSCKAFLTRMNNKLQNDIRQKHNNERSRFEAKLKASSKRTDK